MGVTLPYSRNCRFKNVVTKETRETDPNTCDQIKARSLILTPEAWNVIRGDIQSNCVASQCTLIRTKIDELFLTIDQGLQKLPW
jgi:hypothetical protein